MKTKHPAIVLFDELFQKAASQDLPQLPEYYVPRNFFHKKCKELGIDSPENFIDGVKWEEEIGLTKHVKKVLRAYRKSRKMDQPIKIS